jgi:hypothetical protein
VALAYPMTIYLIHRWIFAAKKQKMPACLIFNPKIEILCILRLGAHGCDLG